jgi:hypothetical protein
MMADAERERMKARAYADAPEGMADGYDSRFWLFRPPELVISVLRRAAAQLRMMAELLERGENAP